MMDIKESATAFATLQVNPCEMASSSIDQAPFTTSTSVVCGISAWECSPVKSVPINELSSLGCNVLEETQDTPVSANKFQDMPKGVTLANRRNAVEDHIHLLTALAEKEVDKCYIAALENERDGLLDQINVSLCNFQTLQNEFRTLSHVHFTTVKKLETLNGDYKTCKVELQSLTSEKGDLQNELTSSTEKLSSVNKRLQEKEKELHLMLQVSRALKNEKQALKDELRLQTERFLFHKFCNDGNASHYTGLPNMGTFYWLLSMIGVPMKYYYDSNVVCLSRADQLFVTLLKLKRNVSHQMLSDIFKVSTFSISNVIITWINALHTVLVKGLMGTVPSLKKIQQSMPDSFKNYPNCRMIFDCTEVTVQVPRLMSNHNLVHSNYKHRCTFKGLVGCAPNGTTIFVSKLFPGSTSDKNVVLESVILKVFMPGDAVMGDKGFLIKDILPAGVVLHIPPVR